MVLLDLGGLSLIFSIASETEWVQTTMVGSKSRILYQRLKTFAPSMKCTSGRRAFCSAMKPKG